MAVVDIVAVFVSVLLLIRSFGQLKRKFNCRLFYYWFFWLIFVVPVILDYTMGYPVYGYYGRRMWGFIQSCNDTRTRILYDAFIIFVQIMIQFHKPHIRIKRKKTFITNDISDVYNNQDINNLILSKKMERLLIIVAIIGPILCILIRSPQVIFQFGWREAGKYKEVTERGFFSIIEEWSYVGVLASLILLMFDRRIKSASTQIVRWFAAVLLYFNLSIESKRSIIMFLLIMVSYIFLLKNQKKNVLSILIALGIFSAIALGASMYIKIVSRGYVGFEALYTTTRVDIFRDDTVKLVLYSLFNKGTVRVLSYPFESYVMQIGYLLFLSLLSAVGIFNIPRRGYDYFITAAVMGGGTMTDKWMTSSMYDEAIANFGLLGIVIVGVLLSYYLRYIDDLPKFESIIWLSFLILYTMYSLDYIIIFAEAMVFIHILMNIRIYTSQGIR